MEFESTPNILSYFQLLLVCNLGAVSAPPFPFEVAQSNDMKIFNLLIFEVRVLDPKGKVMKTISNRELSKRHWKTFDQTLSFALKNKPKEKALNSVRKQKQGRKAS